MNGAFERRHRPRPKNWADFHREVRYRWLVSFLFVDWVASWAAFFLSRTSILEFLEYCGSFSILIGVIFYFLDAPQRTKIKHYQAWQVINTAQGKGGSGGRAEALQELNEDHVRLVGVDLSDAFLQNIDLQKADLRRGYFHGADLKDANLSGSNFESSNMVSANFTGAKLTGADFADANLDSADLSGATLAGAKLANTDLTAADLRGADLAGIVDWKSIQSLRLANIHAVVNPPEGFVAWAIGKGAVDSAKGN